VSAVKLIANEMTWEIERIALDAPAAPPATSPRLSEDQLGRLNLSSFRTPTVSEWVRIREKCIKHLLTGRPTAALPHANKIWMLFGFALFTCMRKALSTEVIEVYPFAIVRALRPACEHKSTEQGYQAQLAAVAARTGWEPRSLEATLKTTVRGSRHDKLDAFMAAWIASLPPKRRRAFGDARQPDDAIWVPL
jgi:Protein of unknown function (DUF429)